MGFIENLGRELEEKRKKSEAERRRSTQRREARDAERLAVEKMKLESKEECFAASDFPRLVKELADLINGSTGVEDFSHTHVFLFWSDTDGADYNNEGECIRNRRVEIRAMEDWTIKVIGGLFGSTTLKKSDWYGNVEAQEKALEKAYRHPKIQGKPSKEPGFFRDDGGGYGI